MSSIRMGISETEAHRQSISEQMFSSVQRRARIVGDIKVVEFVLGFFLVVESSFGLPIPVSQIAMMMLVAWALLQRPKYVVNSIGWLAPILVLVFSYLAILSFTAHHTEFAYDWTRRLLRLVITAFFMLMVASGRLHLRSILYGATLLLAINVPLWKVGIAPQVYEGYLTGYLEDKNVSGLAYCIVGILVVAFVKSWWSKVPLFIFFGWSLWLTGSRTSMTAFLAGFVWIILAPRITMVWRWIMAGVIVIFVNVMAEDYSQIGRFSSRKGSDLLRERIGEASQIKADGAGFWGLGLGESYVRVQDQNWFFHSSYLAAIAEGGYPWLILVVGVTLMLGVRPFLGGKLNQDQAVAQAAAVAIMICAWRLGEVFFTQYWALVIALALQVGHFFATRSNAALPESGSIDVT